MAELKSIHNEFISDSHRLLSEAIDMEFESVVIIGFKNNQVKINFSTTKNHVQVLGAIEAAKYELLEGWK